MNPIDAIRLYLTNHLLVPIKPFGHGRASANIALIKYWGKRPGQLNLPMNSSLSLTMGHKGALTRISVTDSDHHNDIIQVNGKTIDPQLPFAIKISQYLDIFGMPRPYFEIETWLDIPHSAGLASSSAGFSALILAIDDMCGWQLSRQTLSKLARLGSGSAARSLWSGFVEWHAGKANDGNDSYAEPLAVTIPDLRLGIIMIDQGAKTVSSRTGMLNTLETSPLYPLWPQTATHDLGILKQALYNNDFTIVGQTAEANSLAMHATMMAARPALIYSTPETLATMQQIWELRRAGTEVYFTQDAGANLKLLYLAGDQAKLASTFSNFEAINPWSHIND